MTAPAPASKPARFQSAAPRAAARAVPARARGGGDSGGGESGDGGGSDGDQGDVGEGAGGDNGSGDRDGSGDDSRGDATRGCDDAGGEGGVRRRLRGRRRHGRRRHWRGENDGGEGDGSPCAGERGAAKPRMGGSGVGGQRPQPRDGRSRADLAHTTAPAQADQVDGALEGADRLVQRPRASAGISARGDGGDGQSRTELTGDVGGGRTGGGGAHLGCRVHVHGERRRAASTRSEADMRRCA